MIGHWILVIAIIIGCVAFTKKEATSRECFMFAYWALGILCLQTLWGLGLNIGNISEILSLNVVHKLRVGIAFCYGFGVGGFLAGMIKHVKENRALPADQPNNQ